MNDNEKAEAPEATPEKPEAPKSKKMTPKKPEPPKQDKGYKTVRGFTRVDR